MPYLRPATSIFIYSDEAVNAFEAIDAYMRQGQPKYWAPLMQAWYAIWNNAYRFNIK